MMDPISNNGPQEVPTPGYIKEFVREHLLHGHWFDPCPLQHEFDGLEIPWENWAFVNPPYNNQAAWFQKAAAEIDAGRCSRAIFLVPFGPHYKYWAEYVWPRARTVYVFTQPLVFEGYSRPFPMPMSLVVLDVQPRPQRLVPLQIEGWTEHHFKSGRKRAEIAEHYEL